MSHSKNRKASVEKPQSEFAESEAGEHAQLEAGARRHLLGLGFPAAVALFATACGNSMFGNSRSKSSGAKPEPDLGNGGLDTNNKPKPDPKANEGGPEDDNNDNPTKIEPGPSEPPPCSFQGLGIISPLPALGGVNPAVRLKAYGDQADTMVVAKSTDLRAGDVLLLVEKLSDTKGKVIARRKLTSLDVVQQKGVVIFDGVHLGVDTETLTTVVYRDGMQIRGGQDFAVDSIFQVKIKNPFPNSDQTPAYDIVDVFSIRGDSRYALKGAHPNYWDGSDLTICMAFGGPSASTPFGKQGAKGEENRNYVQATMSASWAAPSAAYLPVSYVVCDAFGDLLSASLTGSVTLLRTHSVLLVYVQDGSHFHRYFFHVG